MSEMTLPEGWESTTLDSLLTHVIGGDWGQEALYEASDFESVYCIRGSEFKNWKKELGSTAVRRKVKKSSLQTRALQSNDILVEISGGGPDQPVGRTVLITDQVLSQFDLPVVCTNFLRLARPSVNISATYLSHYLANFYVSGEVINYQGGSNNLRNLKFKEYSSIAIPLPPLAEQKVIADQLDALLAQVERTKARLERVPDILKQFRQSVLAAAVSGKLTEGWREKQPNLSKINLDDITVFWKKRNKKAGTIKDDYHVDLLNNLPDLWLSTRVGLVFDVYVGSTPSRAVDEYWNGDIPWVSSSEVAFCRIADTKEYITEEGLKNSSTNLHPVGTVMLAMIGQGKTRGQVAILDVSACHNQNTAALRVPDGFVVSEFLYFFLSKQYDETRRVGGGNNQQALNKASVQSLVFPLPPLEEQAEIVRRVETLFAHADKIEQQAQAGLARVNQLTQSILAKAFRGELTAQWRKDNPELISGENSAEALLDRIQAEKSAMGGKKIKKKAE